MQYARGPPACLDLSTRPVPARIPAGRPSEPRLRYHRSMKTTVDIPDEELEEVLRHTRARSKRDAIVTAISDFNRRKRVEKLAEQLGTFDDVVTLEELLRLREMD